MNEYELMAIVYPNLGEEEIDGIIEDLKGIITKEGEILEIDKWGIRDLATEFNKQKTGYYVLFTFKAAPTIVEKLNSAVRVNENILRILVSKGIIRREKAAAKSN